MRILLGEHIDTAMHSLRMNRVRTLLTTIGVAIGVASVTTILALAQGVTTEVDRQVGQVGGSVAVVRPGVEMSQDLTRPVLPQQFNTSSLTEGDVDTIMLENEDLIVAPIMTINATLHNKDISLPTTLVATTPLFTKTTDLPIDQGQFLDQSTGDNVAVLGRQLAIDLFGTDVPIGQRFTVGDEALTVIGVFRQVNSPLNYNNVDFDNAAVISFDRGKTLHEGRTQIQQINIRAESHEALQAAITNIDDLLTTRHGEKDFQILTSQDVATSTSRTFQWIAAAMAAIAAISLIVGGIGIMNIMLVGVAERTREVGIRKSVGASNGTIVMQFLMEALLLSLLGGIVGVTSGVVLAFSLALALYFAPVFTWQIIATALGVSVGIGVLFGLYPAIRASRKDPIESLRQYR